MIFGKGSGILGLIAQAAVCVWANNPVFYRTRASPRTRNCCAIICYFQPSFCRTACRRGGSSRARSRAWDMLWPPVSTPSAMAGGASPFGIFWTPVALFKNLMGTTTVRAAELLQPAPAKPADFGERFQKNFSSRLRGGFFVDEKPAGSCPRIPWARSSYR
jgi:hypothetical protein